MFIQQVSVFVENRPGRVQTITKSLSEHGINIRALSLADTTDFGVLRIIVDDTDKACKVIRDQGIVAKVTNVIAVYVDDHTGGLASVLATIADEGIDIKYMYVFLGRIEGKALMVMKVDDDAAAEEVLTRHGIGVVGSDQL